MVMWYVATAVLMLQMCLTCMLLGEFFCFEVLWFIQKEIK